MAKNTPARPGAGVESDRNSDPNQNAPAKDAPTGNDALLDNTAVTGVRGDGDVPRAFAGAATTAGPWTGAEPELPSLPGEPLPA